MNDGAHRGNAKILEDPQVVKVMRSGLLDTSICVNCLNYDGTIYEKADAAEIEPPTDCLGRSLCRCVLVYILADESPQPETIKPSQLPPMVQRTSSENGSVDNSDAVVVTSKGGRGGWRLVGGQDADA